MDNPRRRLLDDDPNLDTLEGRVRLHREVAALERRLSALDRAQRENFSLRREAEAAKAQIDARTRLALLAGGAQTEEFWVDPPSRQKAPATSRLLRLCLNCITKPWSPIAWCGRWYGRVVDAWTREVFQPDRPVTWTDLNPFARSPSPERITPWVRPDDGATP
ncbi:MAG: hypothetical protein LT106_18750 [Burkholderiaceae bacterium]|nr:hypothetical protein [Burkholderiaceae bacterium]